MISLTRPANYENHITRAMLCPEHAPLTRLPTMLVGPEDCEVCAFCKRATAPEPIAIKYPSNAGTSVRT